MVSTLWKAAADGDLDKVKELLKGASNVEIEIKDHTGVTPLIQAVKNGHVEIVKELLAAGADPTNASSQGRPETYTEDATILEILSASQIKNFLDNNNGDNTAANATENPAEGAPVATYENQEGGNYTQDVAPAAGPGYDPAFRGYYYMPPPPNAMYPPYGYMQNPSPEGMPMQGYYPPPPPQQQQQSDQQASQSPQQRRERQEGSNGSAGNLPPADIARTIPCRYYPMCKYGPSCLFAHPPPQFFNGPPPPAPHYAGPYDPHAPPPFPPAGYYGVPPPHSFVPPPPAMNGMTPNAAAGGPPPQHTPSPHAPAFNPSSASAIPPPVPYAVPYPPPQNGAVPMVPPPHVTIPPNAAYPPHPPAVMAGPQPFPPVSPTHHRKESMGAFSQQPQVNGSQPQANGFDENHHPSNKTYGEDGAHQGRDGPGRRGGFRRNSFGGRKPPCLFFPTNKCRNGDQCRFPHIRPEDDPEAFGPAGFPPNSYPSRFRNRPHFGPIHEKNQKNDSSAPGVNGQANGHVNGHTNGYHKTSPRSEQNGHLPNHRANGKFNGRNGVSPNASKQRIPNADDFPSLSGSTTPPTPLNGVNGINGPTAAQVLKGGAPKDVVKAATEKLEESMARVSLEANGAAKDYNSERPIKHSAPEISIPTFASISASVPKLVGTAA
ncbi:hypothetical protein FRC03_006122 [Tulasnella sp. 419]|nr:hypothetical protein FRC03_006122 [Tulasnella sp. 419]